MTQFLVNRCVCHSISFEDVKQIAKAEQFESVRELRAAEVCSTKCKMCEPYLELMIKTGEVAFEPGAYIGRKKIS